VDQTVVIWLLHYLTDIPMKNYWESGQCCMWQVPSMRVMLTQNLYEDMKFQPRDDSLSMCCILIRFCFLEYVGSPLKTDQQQKFDR